MQPRTQEPSSIKQLIQGMIPDSLAVIVGRVVSASPLKIQAANDDKLILSENVLRMPRHLTDYTVSVRFQGETSNMTVYNGLNTGETVYLLSFNNGKRYYVLDKE